MKISIIMNTLVLWFYIDTSNILVDILIQNIDDVKINENSKNIKKNSKYIYKRKKKYTF